MIIKCATFLQVILHVTCPVVDLENCIFTRCLGVAAVERQMGVDNNRLVVGRPYTFNDS